MQINECMSTCVVSVGPLTTIESAARLMRDERIGALPVVRENEMIGMITDRDIVVRGVAENKDGMFSRVSDIMSHVVHHCSSGANVEEAVDIMARFQIRRLPIVDANNQLIGMVALADLALKSQDAASFVLGEISEPHEGSASTTFDAVALETT